MNRREKRETDAFRKLDVELRPAHHAHKNKDETGDDPHDRAEALLHG